MTDTSRYYIPALRFRWLTRFYDSLLTTTLKEERFKGLLVEQAALEPGLRVLDLGCGTATLTIMLKRACPRAEIVGLDGDPEALAISRRKIEAARLGIELREGMSYLLPFEDRSLDRVVSSLVFHHLTSENKRRTLTEIRRVLKTSGGLHVADWGGAQNLLMRIAFLGVQLFDGFATTSDNVEGRLIPMMEEAGFDGVEETHREMTLFGTLSLYRASCA
ncbi:MAG: class I SAM-dependent methyltransferase [Gammaproteobacteria bacterium]